MRAALALGAATPLLFGVLSGACSASRNAAGDPVNVALTTTLLAPRGLLSNVDRLSISVYDVAGSVACDEATSRIAGVDDKTPVVGSTNLGTTDCVGGARFCGKLDLTRATSKRAFFAVAFVGGVERAIGCKETVVDQEALGVEIAMVRSIPAAVCGDGALQPTEQCEPPGANDPVCDAACHSKEVLLSGGIAGAGTTNGKPSEKLKPTFVWPATTGRGGKFLAFFGDKSPANHEITMRVLSDAFGPYREQGATVQDGSFFLPNVRGSVVGGTEANDQLNPTAAAVGTGYFVAFQDNTSGSPDIHLRSLDDGLAAQEPVGNPIGINGVTPPGGGESGIQSSPSMAAGPGSQLFIAWQDDSAGKIVGRMWNPQSKAYGTQTDLSQGTSNRRVAVAGTSTGWLVVWESGTDVKLRVIGANGAPSAAEQTVNDARHTGSQEQPSIATLGDGRFAVAWTDRGAAGGADVFVQRYAADGTKVAGDQNERVNDLANAGDQTAPAIAGMTAASGSFVVAWVDETTGHVRARLLGGASGFLFNNVTGQQSEFEASVESRRTRGNPTIAVGGSGPFIAIGWEDQTGDAKAGIYGRRFPLPTE